jgi:hypothetical protein
MNDKLPHGCVASYRENTNKFKLATNELDTNIEIGVGTTCGDLPCIVVGESSVNNIYEARNGVNLAGTPHFICEALRTQNRDPVCLGYSHLMAKILIARSFNGIEYICVPFVTQYRSIDFIVNLVLDEDFILV